MFLSLDLKYYSKLFFLLAIYSIGHIGVIPSVSSSLFRKCDPQSRHNSLAVTILRLNQILITLVHLDFGCTLDIMWPKNIQNGFKMFVLF